MKDLSFYSEQLGISLTEEQLSQFEKYMNMVVEKNKVMNLTAITEPEDFYLKHFADSLSVVSATEKAAPIQENSVSLIDVGTGAGFPAIPLKIAFPQIKLTLLDSLNKRVGFLNDVIDTLQLSDTTAIHARAEEGARKAELRDSFDFVVSRAVASMNVLTEYCLPYAKPNGLFIAYKSGEIEDELTEAKNAIKLLGGKLEDIISFNLADSDIERSFVIIRKVSATPKRFPRKPGTAKKDPL
ncbi:MAG: 16S rRNA (guanine(527)-N(7))-methyltransferase RsmG [Eubacterium sp.]|nr:16S rRNA (guanine(527)-N(7))-methyltransferase RsmG [Eubacterium sp.]